MSDKLTFDLLHEMFEYSPHTGELRWRVKPNRRIKVGSVAGSTRTDGYVRVKVNKVDYLAHRIIWFMEHAEWPEVIDHIDHDPSNNRLDNLRAVTQPENARHRKGGCKNYCKNKGKYRVKYQHNGVVHDGGSFATEQEAAEAVERLKRCVEK